MSVEIAWKQNILVTDFHLLKSLLVVFGFGSQAFVCGFSRQNINSVAFFFVQKCSFASSSLYVIPNSSHLHHLLYPKGKKIDYQRAPTFASCFKFSKKNTLMYEFGLPQKECGSAFFFVLIMQLRLFLFLCESQCCLTALLACWVACFFACLRKSFNFLMSSSCFTC